MNVKFYPDKSDRPKTVLMLSVAFEGNRLKFSSGVSIENDNWDSLNQSVKKRVPKASEINSFLKRIELKITEFYNESLNVPKNERKEFVSRRIKELLSPGSLRLNDDYKTLTEHFELFIEKRKKSQEFSPSIISAYNNALMHLKGYLQFTNNKLNFDSFDEDFFDSFTSYLTNRFNLTRNSVGYIIKSLKTFLNDAIKSGLTTNDQHKSKLKTWKTETTAIALNDEEVERLYKLDLSDNKKLAEIRDLFLIQIYTGVRFSDLKNLIPEKINLKEEIITLNMRKTKENLVIPIFNKTREILIRYPNLQLPRKTKQEYNKGVKKICEMAEIDDPCIKTIFIGKERKEIPLKKFEMVSSHTARRTFITLLLKKDVHPRYIMKISGHKNVQTFDKYIRLTQNEAIEKLRSVMDK
jgi:integrase